MAAGTQTVTHPAAPSSKVATATRSVTQQAAPEHKVAPKQTAEAGSPPLPAGPSANASSTLSWLASGYEEFFPYSLVLLGALMFTGVLFATRSLAVAGHQDARVHTGEPPVSLSTTGWLLVAITVGLNTIAIAELVSVLNWASVTWHPPLSLLGDAWSSLAAQIANNPNVRTVAGSWTPAWLMAATTIPVAVCVIAIYGCSVVAFGLLRPDLTESGINPGGVIEAAEGSGRITRFLRYVAEAFRLHVFTRFATQEFGLFFLYIAAIGLIYGAARLINGYL
jgi:hypothetical protein